MQDFYLPDTYYDPPEPHEQVILVMQGEIPECKIDGVEREADAWTWDGETWIVWCDECDAEHTVIREVPEPDWENVREAQMENAEPPRDWEP